MSTAAADALLCPSAQPDWHGAHAIGVVGGSAEAPRVGPLAQPLAVTPELLALAEPVMPTEVFRFAAPCIASQCRHFGEGSCRLATKIVRKLEAVTEALPHCLVRAQCRWFRQEKAEACRRCPQVVTDNALASSAMREAADPRLVPTPPAGS
jgi:hypothetical protein